MRWKKQFASAFESEYFDGIRNSTTNAVERPILEIIQYLYDEYGDIILEQIMDNEKEIKRYMFDPVQSVSTILNAIIGYKDLCELLVEVITDIAMVKIGYA